MSPDQIRAARERYRLSDLIRRQTKLVRRGKHWVGLCPLHPEKTPSFYVDDGRGTFKCFGCNAHGDAIDWVMLTEGKSFREAVDTLAEQELDTRLSIETQKIRSAWDHNEDIRRIAHAHALWLKRAPVEGTLAERYLREARGIIKGRLSPILGFHEAVYCGETRSTHPALIAPLQDRNGHVTAIQQIFLKADGESLRDVNGKRLKRTLGAMRDGSVRLALPLATLGLAGSVEDALSAQQLYSIPCWATCGEARMAMVWVPPEIEKLVIFADNDESGDKLARAAKEARIGMHVEVRWPPPGSKDWNAYLTGNRT